MAYNKDNLHSFLDLIAQKYPGSNNSTYKSYKSFLLKTLEVYCEQYNVDFVDFSTEDIIKTITSKRVAVNGARRYISYMRQYGEWLLKENKISVTDWEIHPINKSNITKQVAESAEHQQVQKSRYFTSYQEFNLYLSQLFSQTTTGTEDISRFYTDIAILYLAWMGFSTDEMLQLTNADVTPDGIKDRPYENIDMCNFFIMYRDRQFHIRYYGYSGTRIREWVREGNRLLKGTEGVPNKYRLHKAGLTATKLASKLPAEHPRFNQKLKMEDVKQSGLFCRIYQYQQQHPHADNTTIISVFEKDMDTKIENSHTTGFLTMREYKIWKSLL